MLRFGKTADGGLDITKESCLMSSEGETVPSFGESFVKSVLVKSLKSIIASPEGMPPPGRNIVSNSVDIVPEERSVSGCKVEGTVRSVPNAGEVRG